MTISELYQLYLKHPVVTTDSRNCPQGSIFVALKGENFNGNAFAHIAIEQGCAYAIVDESEYAGNNERIILVEDSLVCLQQLANHHRQQLGIPIIGITGTNGKTTTKELIATVLKQKYKTRYTQGNLNNHIGVPLTLLSLTCEDEMAVVEMGANHVGEIKTLVEIACPDYGIITNVGKAHLEGFGSFENIIRTKGELYDYIRQTDGKIFINADNACLMEIAMGIEQVTYSLLLKGVVNGKITANSPTISLNWSKAGDDQSYDISSNLIGTYNAENIMAAVCVGVYFGVEPTLICHAIESYTPQNNRSQLIQTTQNKLIVDAYNANPTSMDVAIRNFTQMEVAKKVAILGDMRELGKESKKEHQQIVDLLREADFDEVYLVGLNFSETKSSFRTFATLAEFLDMLKRQPITGAYILIKASRGMKFEQLITSL